MKVFVSATSNGLGCYRRGVAAIIEALGEEPVFQEVFPADYRTVEDVLKKEIHRCQAVICLIGPAYGTKPSKQPTDPPRSYTQLEYLFARETKLPVYVFDGRQCDLDQGYCEEPTEERELQEGFWRYIERNAEWMPRAFKSQADLDLQVIKIWKEWRHEAVLRVDLLPTPLARLHSEVSKASAGRVRSCLTRLMAFAGCLGVVEAMHDSRIQPSAWSFEHLVDAIDLLQSLHGRIEFPFVQELWKSGLSVNHALLDDASTEVDEQPWENVQRLAAVWGKAFTGMLQQLGVLTAYLLVQVEYAGGTPRLRIHRGLDPGACVALEWSQNRPASIPAGSVFLLSLDRREGMCVSPVLQPYEDDPRILCGISALQEKALPLGLERGPQRTQLKLRDETGWRGELFTAATWEEMLRQFQLPSEADYACCSDWRVLGKAYHSGRFIDLHFANRDDRRETPPAMLYWARPDLTDNERRRLAERLKIWRRLAADPESQDVVFSVLDGEYSGETTRPYIVTPSSSGYRPISETLALVDSLSSAKVAAIMKAAMRLCRLADRNGVRLLALHPRHTLINDADQPHFVGFDSAVAENTILPAGSDLRLLFPDANDLAPELHEGARACATSDVFALGAFLKRLHNEPILPLPLGEKDNHRDTNMWDAWRGRPVDCFVFHCLTSDRYRRFQSIDQCEEFFEICIQSNALSLMSQPQMVSLSNGIDISRFPITNFQFERFCHDQKRLEPTRCLRWRYATPFAPVVWVSLQDALAFCDWLNTNGKERAFWRLPCEREWLFAAGVDPASAFPTFTWGDEVPTRVHANCAGDFGGPTVVGSHPLGKASTGCQDLSGNVWEWCVDRLPGRSLRVVKGGSFASPRPQVRMASSDERFFGGRFLDVGFRVVRERR